MDVNSLIATVLSGLSALVVEGVTDGGDVVVVTARTRQDAVPCPVCGTPTAKVHGYYGRMVTDVPVDGRPVLVRVRVRRLVCPVLGCPRQTFREQIAGLLERYQRRTVRLAGHTAGGTGVMRPGGSTHGCPAGHARPAAPRCAICGGRPPEPSF